MGRYKTIRDRIYTVVNALAGSGQPLVAVYKTHDAVPSGTPYATLMPSDMPATLDTVAENLRTYSFDLYIWHSIQDADVGEANAVDTVMDIGDQVIDALDDGFTLSGDSNGGLEASTMQIRVFDTAAGPMVGAKIVVKCRALVSF